MECKASNSEEFCAPDMFHQDYCYPNRLGKGHCGGSNSFMGQCRYVMPRYNGMCTQENSSNHKIFNFENYGAHSRCVLASDNSNKFRASCVNTRCTGDKVEFQFGKEVFSCPSEGNHEVNLSVYKGTIKCPSFKEMCTEVMDHRCPMDCYSQGFCMSNGTCQCLGAFTGDDCNKGLPKETDPFVTDFDIRKKNQPEEPKRDDEDEKKEDEEDRKDEEEKDEENEDDNENDEENEDSNEDEYEEEKEDEDSKSEKAILLEKRIAKYQDHLDYYKLKVKIYQVYVRLANFCLEEKPNKKWICHRRLDFYTKRLNKATSRLKRIQNIINNLKEELYNELSENLKKKWQKEQDELLVKWKEVILEHLVARFDKKKSCNYKMVQYYNKWIEYYEKIKQKMPTKYHSWYQSIIDKYTKAKNYYLAEINVINEEIKNAKKHWSYDSQSDLTKAILVEISDEIEEQINNNLANKLDSIVRP